jgi:hypothetical protein
MDLDRAPAATGSAFLTSPRLGGARRAGSLSDPMHERSMMSVPANHRAPDRRGASSSPSSYPTPRARPALAVVASALRVAGGPLLPTRVDPPRRATPAGGDDRQGRRGRLPAGGPTIPGWGRRRSTPPPSSPRSDRAGQARPASLAGTTNSSHRDVLGAHRLRDRAAIALLAEVRPSGPCAFRGGQPGQVVRHLGGGTARSVPHACLWHGAPRIASKGRCGPSAFAPRPTPTRARWCAHLGWKRLPAGDDRRGEAHGSSAGTW